MTSNKIPGFIISVLLLAAITGYTDDYAVKPAWWDSVKVTIDKGNNLYTSYTKSLSSGKGGKIKFEDWQEIGPFDDAKGDPWNFTYPPEKEINLNASYPGKDGKQIKWQKWAAGAKNPLPENLTYAVIFFYNTLTVKAPERKYLLFASDDGAEVKLNGKQVFIFKDGRQLNPDAPDIIPLDLKAGKNEFLVKLQQGGGEWGISAWLSNANPVFYEIKLITELLKAYPSDVPESTETLTIKLINAYAKINDTQNMFFWTEALMKRKANVPAMRKILENNYNLCLRDDKMLETGKEFFKRIFESNSFDKQVRGQAAAYLMEIMLKKGESNELLEFLDKYNFELKDQLSHERLFYKLRAYIAKLDYENANNTIKEIEPITGLKERRDFMELSRKAESLKTSPLQVEMDWEFNSVIENANKCIAEKNTTKLNRLIQNTLLSKKFSLIETEDKNLLAGAVVKYKEALIGNEKSYTPNLDKYLEILKTKGNYSELQNRKRKGLLSFSRPAVKKENEPAANSVANTADIMQADTDNLGFNPLIVMNPGYIELLKNENPFTGNINFAPQCNAITFKNSVFIQNSRQVLRISSNKVAWNRNFQNSALERGKEKTSEQTAIFPGQFSPKTDGSLLFARLIAWGKPTLFAFDCNDGRTVWDSREIDIIPCSDPVIYQDQILVIAKKQEIIAQYFLLSLNSKTGDVEDRIYLFSGQETFPLSGVAEIYAVQLDLFMPEPVVKDGRAYISTNSGIMFCVDVEGDFTVWARKYPRTPFSSASIDLPYTFGKRKSSPPLVGKENVLFAPFDAPGMFLLNRETGALVSENTSVKAAEIHPAGDNSALIIEKKSNANIYSLNRLEPVKALTGANYRFIEDLRDGFILSENNVIEIWSDTFSLVRKIKVPPSFVPISLASNTLYGYESNKTEPVIGSLIQPNTELSVLLRNNENNLQNLDNPRIKTVNNTNFIISDNYLILLNDKLATVWAVPLKSGNVSVLCSDKSVFLISRSSVLVLRKKDGALLNWLPKDKEPMKKNNYMGAALFSGKLYVGETLPSTYKTRIIQVDEIKSELKGMLNFVPLTLSLYNEGDSLLVGMNNNILDIYKFNKVTQAYDKTDKTYKPGKGLWDYRRISFDDNHTLFLSPHESFDFDFLSMTFRKFDIKAWPNTKWDWNANDNNFKIAGQVIACSFQSNVWTLLDMEGKKDLSQDVSFFTAPVSDGKNLLGLVLDDPSKRNLSAVCFDMKARKSLYKESVNPYLVLPPNTSAHNELNFIAGEKSYHFFHPANNREMSEENALVVQDFKNKKVEIKSFPGYSECPGAISSNGNVLMLINSSPKVFTSDELLKLMDKVAPVYDIPTDTKFQCVIDGYPDEWDVSKFQKSGKNSFYAAISKDNFVFAGLIRDEALIKEIGASGLDKKLSFAMMPGSAACFRTDNAKTAGFSNVLAEKDASIIFDYSIPPAGDSCFFEISVPMQKIFHCDPKVAINAIKNIKSREIRGDLAFSFVITDDGKNRQGVFSKADDIPLYYPRIKFVFGK